jgi:hypothetical protein
MTVVPQSSTSDPAGFWPAIALTLGAAGVVATSLFYLLSPPEVVLPFTPLDLAKSIQGAIRGARTLHLAGLIGILSDVTLASAALSFGALPGAAGHADSRTLGWMLLATGTLVFIVVDTTLGFVLPNLAIQSAAAFLGFKALVDTLFALGTFTFGLGGVLLLVPYVSGKIRGIGRAAWPALIFAIISLFAGLGTLLGFNLPILVGIGVGGSAVAFIFVGLGLLRSASRA